MNESGVCKLLDQTQRKNICIAEKDTYNPCREVLNKSLNKIVNDYTQICGFTLTFQRKFHDDDDRWLHRHVHHSLINHKKWKKVKYIIIPEFTPKRGQLHYHGIIWDEFDLTVMECLKYWRRKYGFVKPELRLKNPHLWIKYMCKDFNKTGLWTISNLVPRECGKPTND